MRKNALYIPVLSLFGQLSLISGIIHYQFGFRCIEFLVEFYAETHVRIFVLWLLSLAFLLFLKSLYPFYRSMWMSCRHVQGGVPLWISLHRQDRKTFTPAILLVRDGSRGRAIGDAARVPRHHLSSVLRRRAGRMVCRNTGNHIIICYQRIHEINFHCNVVHLLNHWNWKSIV